jgi:hypothetical protein
MTRQELAARERRKEQRRQEMLQAQASAPPAFPVVIPFEQWCQLVGCSIQTGRRLAQAGKVKITQLSGRRIGVRSDHHLEYLNACARGSA